MKLSAQAHDTTEAAATDTLPRPGPTPPAAPTGIEPLGAPSGPPPLPGRPDAPAGGKKRTGRAGGKGRRLKDLAMFTRQLYVLVASGTPLVQALGALERQVRPGPWRDAIADIRKTIEEGTPLAEAMAAHPDYFDHIYCSLVAAGESGGSLAEMLNRLSRLTRKRIRVRNSIMGALIYPSLLVVVAVAVLTLLMAFMIPRFAELFETLDAPLPDTTKALIALSSFLRSYWWGLLAVVIGGAVAAKMYLSSAAGKRAIDTAVLRTPQLGRIVRNIYTARITRLLGVLLDSQVPVLDALELTRHGTGNVHYAELLTKAHEAVAHGDPISTAFRNSDLISPSVTEAIHSGEQSGQVGALLLNIADFLDEENDVVVRSLTQIIEPVILILMGLLVGFVALSMFMPLFDVTAMTQGGPR